MFLTEASDGAVMMTPYDANFEVQMAEAREIMKRRRPGASRVGALTGRPAGWVSLDAQVLRAVHE